MKILALDTATEACSVAIQVGEERYGRYEVIPRGHGDRILPMMDEVMAEAGVTLSQLDALAFGRGPGGFTGVRIATGVAQGVAFAAELPVVPISTLAALAQIGYERHGQSQVLAAIDARMSEIYWGAYRLSEDCMQLVGEELVCAVEAAPGLEGDNWFGIGSGWATYGEALEQHYQGQIVDALGEVFPDARYILPLAERALMRGEAVAAEQALPVYLRDKVAKKSQKRPR